MLRRQGGKGALKEERAWAVVRDVWQRGHQSVELRHDGRRAIFFCTICETRCYSDSALSDHLHGNVHARNSAAAAAAASAANCHFSNVGQLPWKSTTGQTLEKPKDAAVPPEKTNPSSSPTLYDMSSASLEWVGDGRLFVRSHFSNSLRHVEAAWLRWCGKEALGAGTVAIEGDSEYAIVIIPYSDGLGRSGNKDALLPTNLNKDNCLIGSKKWHPESKKSQGSTPQMPGHCNSHSVSDGKDIQRLRGGLRGWSRKQSKSVDRLCFICRQKMAAGKDVAALLNAKTGEMACGSRNWRGAFHVFHTYCLIDWVALFESKSFSGHVLGSSKKVRRRLRSGKKQVCRQPEDAVTDTCKNDSVIFCPECQGTGIRASGIQLERPRYRLSQVFDWILELVQARKAWIDHPEEQMESITGLLFLMEDNLEICATECRGLVKCYASGCSEVWAANALDRKDDSMELDP
ncbi:hypothetical protein O6H91_07G091300 [Diphasiastrum complanatum]|uniref:Uncharacterized protein n=1 Tax=Diphasiastrum complanatum TaxID=34168 RepID=A0ACC2D7Z7_DIPCM|nr:hypothetical protein O6H91_07G091300 [Diphasiastrum complanatum]